MKAHSTAARVIFALALTAMVAACERGGGDGITGPTPVAAVTVVAPRTTLFVGDEVTLTATVTDAGGQPLADRAVGWTSSNSAVATVSGTGRVMAVGPGTVRITAASEGRSHHADLTVQTRESAVASISLDADTVRLHPGETRQLVATAHDANGAVVPGVQFGWSASGASAAASVSATGLVTAHEMGMSAISASVNGKLGRAIVIVLGTSTHDLVFDRWDTYGGGFNRPVVHLLDTRDPDAVPSPFIVATTSWEAAPSPDGLHIAFTCDNGSPAICIADADGGNVTVLAPFRVSQAMHADQPAWSPDGARITFRGWQQGGSPGAFNPTDIYVVNADGTNLVRLTTGQTGASYSEAPTWSPRQDDGSYRIAFSHVVRGADGYEHGSIQSIRADGQDLRQVTPAGEYLDAQPSWSPDGSTIAFVRTGGEVAGDIWLVSATGGNERALMSAAIEPANVQRAPAWSPDGTEIAFASNHEIVGTYIAWQIYTVRADGTGLVRRTSDRADKGNPAWIKRR